MKRLKYLFILQLKIIKYLFYDMIPEVYDIKWYKHDFDDKLEYYFWLPFRYLGFLIISLLDFEVTLYRIVFVLGNVKGMIKNEKNYI